MPEPSPSPGAHEPNQQLLAALRESEEHYRSAVELNPQVPWTADLQGNILNFNQRWLDMTGLAREEAQGEGWLQVPHPDDLPAMEAAWTHSIQTGDPYDIEHRIRLKSGEYRWMRSRAFPKRDPDGAIVRWYGTTEDIHARKEAEEKLRRSEALHRAVIETMAEAVIVLDAAGEVVTLNSAFAAMHAYGSLEEAYAALWHFAESVEARDLDGGCVPPSEWPAARALRGETVQNLVLEAKNRANGHVFWGSYSAVPVLADGSLAYVVVTVHDLTEVVRAQEAQRRQTYLLDTVEQAVTVTDLDGTITYWNAFAERLYGWTAAEAVGRNILEVTPAEASREQAELIMASLRAGESWAGEFEVRRRDGTSFPAWVTDTPIRNEAGELTGIIGVSIDLTDRKRVEDALRETDERLLERVKQLHEADRQKDEFLALLSHELRNPLAGITNALYVLNRVSAQEEKPRELRSLIGRQVRYLNRLLEDLLDVTRLGRGLMQLRRETIDFAAVISRAVEATADPFHAHAHRLHLAVEPGPLWVEGDPVRLEQVLVNLLTNAAKYTDAGGTIELSARRDGAELVVRVRDNGMGIPAELLPRVFELFTQADRSHARTHGGLGIGLTLVRRIVELHGGTVAADSDGPGRGSEFRVRLPAGATVGSHKARTPELAHGQRTLRVLVIEDDPDAADTLRDLLELAGHTVEVAYSGPAGVRAAAAFRADAILCDIGLPGMDGYAVASELRGAGMLAEARLIAVTGFGQPEDRQRTAAAGFHAHLTKPADPEELLQLLGANPGEPALRDPVQRGHGEESRRPPGLVG